MWRSWCTALRVGRPGRWRQEPLSIPIRGCEVRHRRTISHAVRRVRCRLVSYPGAQQRRLCVGWCSAPEHVVLQPVTHNRRPAGQSSGRSSAGEGRSGTVARVALFRQQRRVIAPVVITVSHENR